MLRSGGPIAGHRGCEGAPRLRRRKTSTHSAVGSEQEDSEGDRGQDIGDTLLVRGEHSRRRECHSDLR